MHPKRHPIRHGLHRGLRRGRHADRACEAASSATPAPTPRWAARCSSAPPATPPAPTTCRRGHRGRAPVYTNNLPCGAMRGFGVNQVTFALESCLDELCAQGGFDRWQFRCDNALDDGRLTATGQVLGERRRRARHPARRCKDEYDAAPALRPRLRHQELRHRQRHGRRLRGEDRDRGAATAWSSTTAGPRWARACTRWPCRCCARRPASTRTSCEVRGRHRPRGRGRHDHLQPRHLAGGQRADRRLRRPDARPGDHAPGRPRRAAATAAAGASTGPPSPARRAEVITHYSYSYATQLVVLDDDGTHRHGGRRPRRGPDHEPRRCSAGRSRARCTWAWATP